AITAVAENEGGLWEPEFAVADDGELVLWFCDETDGENHSQRIVQQTSTDALTWTDPVPIIELEDPTARPGMPNVRRLRTGRWAMTYEICGPQDHCRSYVRTSDDPREWGPATSRDRVIRAVDGTEPRHTPTLLVDEDGSVLLGAQMHYTADGELSEHNGQVVLPDLMTDEICGPPDHCRSYVRTSDDPREWGPAPSRDRVIRAVDGTEPRHTPTLLVDEDGSVLLGAQMHYTADGELSEHNGQVVL